MSTYDLAKKVHDNFISMEEALNNLEEIGMNRNSASMYIDCFQKMIAGELYKRGTSVFAADYYISKIQNDYGDSGLEKATRSLSQHIDYLYSKGFNNIGLRNVLKKYTNNL